MGLPLQQCDVARRTRGPFRMRNRLPKPLSCTTQELGKSASGLEHPTRRGRRQNDSDNNNNHNGEDSTNDCPSMNWPALAPTKNRARIRGLVQGQGPSLQTQTHQRARVARCLTPWLTTSPQTIRDAQRNRQRERIEQVAGVAEGDKRRRF